MIKGVIFDVDGVIVNTENTHFLAFREVLKRYKYDLNFNKYKEHFSGKSIRGGINSLLDEHPQLSANNKENFINDFIQKK